MVYKHIITLVSDLAAYVAPSTVLYPLLMLSLHFQWPLNDFLGFNCQQIGCCYNFPVFLSLISLSTLSALNLTRAGQQRVIESHLCTTMRDDTTSWCPSPTLGLGTNEVLF